MAYCIVVHCIRIHIKGIVIVFIIIIIISRSSISICVIPPMWNETNLFYEAIVVIALELQWWHSN